MIHIDTSALIESLSGAGRSASRLRQLIESGEQILVTSIVLYEWLRGPRRREELLAQEALLPRDQAVHFGPNEAIIAAELYRSVSSARGREIDLAIAACALASEAALWTLNTSDFSDIPGLRLI